MAIQIDEEECVGCGSCEEACPESIIEMQDDVARLTSEDDCVECGACVDACPSECITLDN